MGHLHNAVKRATRSTALPLPVPRWLGLQTEPKLANYGTTTARMLVSFEKQKNRKKYDDCVKRYPSHFRGRGLFRPRISKKKTILPYNTCRFIFCYAYQFHLF